MDLAENAETLIKKRNRLEWWVAGSAICSQFLLAAAQKYWLHQYVATGSLFGSQALLLASGLLFCSFQKGRKQKKLDIFLGKSLSNDFQTEIVTLQSVGNNAAWIVFKNRSRWELAGIFFYSSMLGAFCSTFVF